MFLWLIGFYCGCQADKDIEAFFEWRYYGRIAMSCGVLEWVIEVCLFLKFVSYQIDLWSRL